MTWQPIAKDYGAWRPLEYEIGDDGNRTGRTRLRQFTHDYAKAAKSGIWPDMVIRATWHIQFTGPE